MKQLFLIFTFLFAATLPGNVLADDLTCGENCTWSFDEQTKTLTITGKGAMKDFGPASAPGNYHDTYLTERPWHTIASQVEHVVVSGLTNVGNRAFQKMSNLLTVDLSDSVTSINYGAMSASTYSVQQINIPTSVTNIASYGLGSADNANILIPNSVTSIAPNAFQYVSGTVFCQSEKASLCTQANAQHVQAYTQDANGVYVVTKDNTTYYYSSADKMLSGGIEKGCSSQKTCAAVIAVSQRASKRIYTVKEAQQAVEAADTDRLKFIIRYR